ncbi:Ulp1-like peptidase [Cucumis melo var. makuwa]|uniref:Ulp1-like peptidase n=1 Tax=Cucumis melo var. makuwa TaxID=1194695 RepID=A0A5D3DTX3_CUCMM|nr:Ulp1-like peptidase [Cucumis melo var. makuwa]TYK26954.1 Ulp1-like peptidase [Cucumis melo var. makuwa]
MCLEVEEIFKNFDFTNDDDVVKVALALFIEIVMVGKDKKMQLDIDVLGRVDDEEIFKNFDSSTFFYTCLLNNLKTILQGKKIRPTDPLLNNWFKVQPLNHNPSRTNEKVGPLVQDLDSVVKETTYLLSQKWVGVNSIFHLMYLAIHSILPLKWEAYWASDVELPSPMQI